MSKGFVMTLAGAVVGCVGIGYILGSRVETINEELIDEVGEDLVKESTNVIKKVIEEVKEYMTNKTNATVETLQFCKDVLMDKSCRLTLGITAVSVGVALIASVYIPTPA